MKRIANERAYVEHMLEKKEINEKRPGKDINSLIKYYYELDNTITKEELLDKVSQTLLAIIDDEKAVKRWQVSIKGYINDFMSYADTFRGLSNVEFIEITENEINRIKELKNHKLEYTAFSLLVYLKIRNAITGKIDNVYCPSGEEDVKNMKKISGLKVTLKEFTLLMKQLQDLGYTNNGIGGAVNCKLNYVDIDSKVIIMVKDFSAESIHLYYTYCLGKVKYKHCKECKKIIVFENNKIGCQIKYCDKCAKEIKNEQIRNIMREKRKS